jgi:hypothetical protein
MNVIGECGEDSALAGDLIIFRVGDQIGLTATLKENEGDF